MNPTDTTLWVLPLVAILGVVILVRAVIVAVLKTDCPRVVARPLMTQAELRFLHVLTEALPGYFIACQVSMGALLRPDARLQGRDWWATYGRFSQKIVDFVVIDRGTGSVVVVIELDDRSHNTAKDEARDAMLFHAGYNVVRFGNRPWPTAARVRERLADLIPLGVPELHAHAPGRVLS